MNYYIGQTFIAGELEQPTIEEVIKALPKIEW